MANLRIELDERDGFIYVREKVGKSWKHRFRGTSMKQVLNVLIINYAEEKVNAANKEERNESATSIGTLETIQQ
jgi:hypothetical protein